MCKQRDGCSNLDKATFHIPRHVTNVILRPYRGHKVSPHRPLWRVEAVHGPDNNGVMGKILCAVTSFGFRMYSTGLIEGLCGVCLSMCVSVLPGDMLKRDQLS